MPLALSSSPTTKIATFNGHSHEQCVAEFRRLDLERIQLARCEVALAHYNSIPRGGNGIGELATVRREIEKRNHKPIRQLLKEAGRAVQAIKPVFMMSPISVAQFLEPGAVEFDLLLIDEASQVRPVDALGAIARAHQIVVVGDDKQLPPTQFFNKVLDDGGSDDEDGANVGDLESVLGLCAAQGVTQRMLRWHYRSRHHSLIAVSNREFYENGLFVVPSPDSAEGRGLRFRHISDGVFDRGGSATNRVEARPVAQAVIEHARRFPKQSLGVGTFSVVQRDAILDELELLRREHPDVESFFAAGSLEHFFVKNLENIQGDERDVIFISVAYARDSSGFLSMSFGPLSIEGGERRLNVLITRARDRCEVFSSITADDIDLRRAKSRGAAALKTFLQYAASGMLDAGSPTNREHDSGFEQQVAKALEAFGFEVDAQVGVAGFFVDLAVIDPDRPGRYILGIECDGATYHSSRCARERDRLRQQVLESRGWTIHRIWSTDWFNRPDEQLRKVLAAIEDAKIARPTSEPEFDERPIERGDGSNGELNGSVPYKEASFAVSESAAIHELPVSKLAKLVTQVVEVEGPVHGDEVARRLTTLWGQTRVGSRIASAVAEALVYAERKGAIRKEGAFYLLNGETEIPVRSRENVTSASLRKPEMLPPVEIRSAIRNLVKEHIGAPKNDVIVVSARLFGFKSTSAQLKAFIEQELDGLVQEKQLTERNARLYPD